MIVLYLRFPHDLCGIRLVGLKLESATRRSDPMKCSAAQVFVAACVMLVPAPAHGQGWGLRAGANINPDQAAIGAQYELPLVERVWFQPSGDIGFGNGTTLLAANLDAVQRWALGRRPVWSVYAGGGPALNHYRLPGYSESELGLNLLAGARHARGLFVEFRAGFLQSPAYRFGAGYTFTPKRPQARRLPPRR